MIRYILGMITGCIVLWAIARAEAEESRKKYEDKKQDDE